MIKISGPEFALFVIAVCGLLVPLSIWAVSDVLRWFEDDATSMPGGPGHLQPQPRKVQGPQSRG